MGEVNIAAKEAATVINSLNAHIKNLEGQLAALRQQKQNDIARGIVSTLQYMRANGFVLLYTGHGRAQDAKPQLSEDAAALEAADLAWNLDGAPLPPQTIAAVRNAAAGGSNRWF